MAFAGIADRTGLDRNPPEYPLLFPPVPPAMVLKTRSRFARGDRRCAVRVELSKIKGPGPIRASRDAVPTTDTGLIVDHDDAVGTTPGRMDRTDWHTRRLLTLHAGARDEPASHMGIFAYLLLNHGTIDHTGR
jgi:hypothetical protein